jgi:hypothetical protein
VIHDVKALPWITTRNNITPGLLCRWNLVHCY